MIIGGIGPQAPATAIIGSSSLPSAPTFRQCYVTPSGLYICLADGDWTLLDAGPDTGVVSGAGTTNRLTKWINGAGSVIGDSALLDNGVTVTSIRPIVATNFTDSALTAGRVVFAGTAGLLSDDADFTFATDTLTVTKIIASTNITIGAGSAITSSGAGGALGAIAFVVPGTGVATALAVNIGTAGAFVVNGGALGTPSSGVGTNLTGTASGLTAGTVTTNANLTGPITSSGNATSIAAQTGTGTTFAMSAAPTFTGDTKFASVNISATALPTFDAAASPIMIGANANTQATTALSVSGYRIDNQNLRYDGSNYKYINTAAGSNIVQSNGGISFGTTPSGTAGNTATLTTQFQVSNTGTVFFSTNLSNAAGTPGSLCYNTSNFEVQKNNALTCTVSASEYKTAIAPLTDGLDVLLRMNPSQFAYKDDSKRLRWGFVADDLQVVDSKLADGYDEKGHAKSIDHAAIMAVSAKAIQELNDKVEILEKRILVLSNRRGDN